MVGLLNVWVRVSDAGSNTIRSDAIVTVKAVSRAGGSPLTAPATHENAGNDFNYLAHLPIETSGEWDISVYIEDEPGAVDLSFSETVTGDSNLMTLIALTLPFVALLIGVGVFLWRRSIRSAAG